MILYQRDFVRTQTVVNRVDNQIITQSADGCGDIIHQSTITLGKNVQQEHITDYSAKVIEKALEASNNDKATITSGYRNPKNQARVMYENINRKGVASQKKLYGSDGDKVIDVYSNWGPEWNCTKQQTCDLMEEKIYEVGPGNVSKHSSDPLVYNTIDINPGSLKNSSEFKKAIQTMTGKGKEIKKYIPPGDDPAHHIEIPQPKTL